MPSRISSLLTCAGPSTSSIPTPIATDGHIPAWASLPYHVLLQIFVYAYHSLRDENTEPTAATSWLVRVARMCRAFTKPALTALYRNPPISAMTHNRKDLVEHLVQPPADAHEDYQVMVKRLELDAAQMASTTDPIHSATDLAALITALTTVREIDIFDPLDRPPYRERSKRMRRWTYPDELFDALRRANLRLRSWRWRSSFCAHGPLWMKEIHDDKSFQSLREVTLTKFDPEESRKPDETKTTVEELLGSALAVLPNLKSLVFESCKVVNGSLLPLLPKTLLSLNITNCFNLTSDALEAFLAESGQNLEDLVLNHNQCLDLSFLVSLKQSCPQLEVLRMDLNYYSSLMMSSDNEPLYDFLLGEDEIPTWPSTLKVIDMEYLRHWSSNAATNFFTSIIDSADELPRLRELQILAMVDVGWRQRADFRRKWAARFERVFARRCSAPSPHLASLRAYREWKTSHPDVKNDSLLDISEEMKNNDNDESDSDVPLVPNSCQKRDEVWGSRRLRTRGKASANYDETSEAEATSDASGGDAGEEPRVIQGQCHTVMVRIDNGRPREEVFDENDFLDPEPSGDEDWNSEVDEVNGWGADSTVAW